MGWLSVIRAGLKLITLAIGLAKDRELMNAGEDKQIAKSLAEIQVALGVSREVEAEVAALTDVQVDAQLEQEFRD